MWAEGETRRIVAAQHAEAAVVPEADNATSASGSDSSSDAEAASSDAASSFDSSSDSDGDIAITVHTSDTV
mgnify:CR=1 FL=1|tara:strand:+ start:421 stop:633 length:213 start_codon:yes stop_codon:yes gene_type:complete